MFVCCFDLEGVFLPEFWIEISKRFKIDSLKLTTRDIPDYDRLMRYRLKILRRENIRLADLLGVIEKIRPLPGALRFLDRIRSVCPVIILSDTYYEFAGAPVKKLGSPVLFCNWLKTDRRGFISGYVLRQKDGKRHAVKALQKIGFQVKAVGDSFNDLSMLRTADKGFLFNPPPGIRNRYRQFPVAEDYEELLRFLLHKPVTFKTKSRKAH
jgi:phosphoserine/homoserine phosphotransferase